MHRLIVPSKAPISRRRASTPEVAERCDPENGCWLVDRAVRLEAEMIRDQALRTVSGILFACRSRLDQHRASFRISRGS